MQSDEAPWRPTRQGQLCSHCWKSTQTLKHAQATFTPSLPRYKFPHNCRAPCILMLIHFILMKSCFVLEYVWAIWSKAWRYWNGIRYYTSRIGSLEQIFPDMWVHSSNVTILQRLRIILFKNIKSASNIIQLFPLVLQYTTQSWAAADDRLQVVKELQGHLQSFIRSAVLRPMKWGVWWKLSHWSWNQRLPFSDTVSHPTSQFSS